MKEVLKERKKRLMFELNESCDQIPRDPRVLV